MATQRFLQTQKFKLAGSGVTSSATTIVLQSFQFPDASDIVLADLGTTNYATIEPGTTREEYCPRRLPTVSVTTYKI